MMEKIFLLTSSEIEILKNEFEVLNFTTDFDIVYEEQVPCAGIALIEGEIEIFKDSKVKKKIDHGYLIGIYHFLNEYPVKYGCRIKAKSKIILLGKSAMLNLRQNIKMKDHPIFKTM